MFTGIIRSVGQIEGKTPAGGDLRLAVRAPGIDFSDFSEGESIAVNGVCLTATDYEDEGFVCDVSNETLGVTALGDLEPGAAVNIEPSLAVGERLGGHFVSGHVDCVGRVESIRRDARSLRIEVVLPDGFARYAARKGSISIDGASLTINDVSGARAALNIVPHTAANTIIGDYREGTRVNVEIDLLMRYLERLLSTDGAEQGGLSRERLESWGYG